MKLFEFWKSTRTCTGLVFRAYFSAFQAKLEILSRCMTYFRFLGRGLSMLNCDVSSLIELLFSQLVDCPSHRTLETDIKVPLKNIVRPSCACFLVILTIARAKLLSTNSEKIPHLNFLSESNVVIVLNPKQTLDPVKRNSIQSKLTTHAEN